MLFEIKKELLKSVDKNKAKILSRFFKTGKGEYGQGDKFLGINVPIQRQIAKKYLRLTIKENQKLIVSPIHEHRFVSLLILITQYKKGGEVIKKEIYDFYLKNYQYINNWDLVDLSAPHIIGNYLLDKDRSILYQLAKSANLWKKRIAILSTFAFIKNNQFDDTFKIARILLNDNHDLIHKAVGWMLKEIGKRNLEKEIDFLKKNYKKMPRVMLRYSIEKLDEKKRKFFLKK